MMFNVILNSVDNPGRFTFITVEDADDLEDCINQIRSECSSEFVIDQVQEISE